MGRNDKAAKRAAMRQMAGQKKVGTLGGGGLTGVVSSDATATFDVEGSGLGTGKSKPAPKVQKGASDDQKQKKKTKTKKHRGERRDVDIFDAAEGAVASPGLGGTAPSLAKEKSGKKHKQRGGEKRDADVFDDHGDDDDGFCEHGIKQRKRDFSALGNAEEVMENPLSQLQTRKQTSSGKQPSSSSRDSHAASLDGEQDVDVIAQVLGSKPNTTLLVYNRKERLKHSFEDIDVTMVKIYTGVIFVLSCVMIYSATSVVNCGEHSVLGSFYMITSGVMIVASAAGFYGSMRVKADVEDEIGNMDKVNKHKEKQHDGAQQDSDGSSDEEDYAHTDADDGLQTVGQIIIAVFFVVTLLGTSVWLILTVESFALADDAIVASCDNQKGHMITMGVLGILAQVVFVVGTVFVQRVTSMFYLVRTTAQMSNGTLGFIGAVLVCMSISFIKQM